MTNIPVSKILPNPDQPRTIFDENELAGLAQSIQENGLVQPVVVEQEGENYILVDGERRWRAVKLLNRKTIEATVRQTSNHKGTDRLILALVANIQRSDLGPVDEGRAYQQLYKQLGTFKAVADKMGITLSTITTRAGLLELEPMVQELFNKRLIAVDAGVLARLKELTPEQQIKYSTIAATRGWSKLAFRKYLRKELLGLNGPKNLYHGHDRKKNQLKDEIKVVGHFDALAMVPGGQKLPADIRNTARKTCQACDLYEAAGLPICRQCPLPDFLRRLVLVGKPPTNGHASQRESKP
jgi:ParB/RepB/Spo0J family partition protein